MLERSEFSEFEKLPIDILVEIFAYLSVQDIGSFASTNSTQLNRFMPIPENLQKLHPIVAERFAINGQQFWAHMVQKFYPRTYSNLYTLSEPVNWYETFKAEYTKLKAFTQPLSSKHRKIIMALFSGQIDSVESMTIRDLDIFFTNSYAKDRPLFKLQDFLPQHTLDKLFNKIRAIYTNSEQGSVFDLPFWAVILKQDLKQLAEEEQFSIKSDKNYWAELNFKDFHRLAGFVLPTLAIMSGQINTFNYLMELQQEKGSSSLNGYLFHLDYKTINTISAHALTIAAVAEQYETFIYLFDQLQAAQHDSSAFILDSFTAMIASNVNASFFAKILAATYKVLDPAKQQALTKEIITSNLFLELKKTIDETSFKKYLGLPENMSLDIGVFQFALNEGLDDVCASMLRSGIDLAGFPKSKAEIILQCADQLMPKTIEVLLNQDPKLIFARDAGGNSLLVILDTDRKAMTDQQSTASDSNSVKRCDIVNAFAAKLSLLIENKYCFNSVELQSLEQNLLFAIKDGHYSLVEAILKIVDLGKIGEDGNAIIHHVAKFGTSKLITKCYQQNKQAFVTPNNDGLTPLMIAASNGRHEVVAYMCRVLLLDVNQVNTKQHLTALDYAIANSQYQSIALLLSKGAKLNKEQRLPVLKTSSEKRQHEAIQKILALQNYLETREASGENKLSFTLLGKEIILQKGIPKEIKLAAAAFLKDYLLLSFLGSDRDRTLLIKEHSDKLEIYREALTQGNLYKDITSKIDLSFLTTAIANLPKVKQPR